MLRTGILSLQLTVTSATYGRFVSFYFPVPPSFPSHSSRQIGIPRLPLPTPRRPPLPFLPRSRAPFPPPESAPLPPWSRRTSPAAAAVSIVGPHPWDAARSLAGGGAGSASLGRRALARRRRRRIRLPALCGGRWVARWVAACSPAATAAGSGSLRCAAGDGRRGAPPTGRRRRRGGRFFFFF